LIKLATPPELVLRLERGYVTEYMVIGVYSKGIK